MIYSDQDLYEWYHDTDDDTTPCPKCAGSGITPEGVDCDYCDGTGELEI